MAWLLGTQSRTAIAELVEAVKSKKLAFCNEELQASYAQYHPFMSKDLEGFDKERFADILASMPKDSPLWDDPELLRKTEDFLALDGVSLAGILYEDIQCRVYCGEDPELFRQGMAYTHRALSRLKGIHPDIYCHFEQVVDAIIPLWTEAGRRRAVSCFDSFGALFMSVNPLHREANEVQWMFDIAHELGHQVLLLYQLADRVLASDYDEPVWSAIRKTERPAIGSLHAAVSLCYILEVLAACWQSPDVTASERQFCQDTLERFVVDQEQGLKALTVCRFTDLGERLISEVEASLVRIRTSLGLPTLGEATQWQVASEEEHAS